VQPIWSLFKGQAAQEGGIDTLFPKRR